MEKLPLTVEDLIEALDKIYPDRSPRPGMGIEDIMYRAGQRSVVVYLLHLLGDVTTEDT